MVQGSGFRVQGSGFTGLCVESLYDRQASRVITSVDPRRHFEPWTLYMMPLSLNSNSYFLYPKLQQNHEP